jgi:nucleoside-diphosphate-sugar epimerase
MQKQGGGDGEIGYHLALALQAQGLKVTMLQDAAAKKSKVPYSLYDDKPADAFANVVWVDPTDESAYAEKAARAVRGGPPITHIFDNFSRGPKEIEPLLSLAKASPDFKLYSFVSSAGMYTAKGEIVESGVAKHPPTGQSQVELKLDEELPGKWASFRPQYIYGPYTNKRGYLDWFLERTAHSLPMGVGVPGDSSESGNLAHCEDVAALLSSVVGREEAASGGVFNCGTSDQITHKAVCEAVGKAVGRDVKVAGLSAGTRTSYPFRPNAESYVNVDRAKETLSGHVPKHRVLAGVTGGLD